MAEEGLDGAADGTPPEPLGKNPQDQFMDVVDKAQASIPPEKFAKKALFILDRDQQPRKFCMWLVEHRMFDRIVMVLIILNTAWMTLITDPILSKKITEDKMLNSEYCAEAHHWAPLYRPFNSDCELGGLPPCSVNEVVDIIFLISFTIEMVFKLIAYGFIMHKGAYLRAPHGSWNLLDFVVVVTGWLQLMNVGGNLSMLRALRPLRVMQRVRKLRVLVQCIWAALPALGSIGVILVFCCTTFGIIGNQLFMGTTRHVCHDCIGGVWGGESGSECIGGDLEASDDICNALCLREPWPLPDQLAQSENCDSIGEGCGPAPHYCTSLGNATLGQLRENVLYWTCRPNQHCLCGTSSEPDPFCTMLDNPNFGANNFDNVFWASVTMFQAITLEGWVDTMYTVIDGSGVFAFLYFVICVLFGACIILNLFLAVLCDNFAIAEDDPEVQDEDEVDGEKEADDAAKALNHTNPIRALSLKIAISQKFMYFITVCILFNALLMTIVLNPNGRYKAMESYQPSGLFWTIWVLNVTLTIIFTFESSVKMIGLGWKIFKMDSFNIFDLVVVIFSLVDVAFDLAMFNDVEIPTFFPVSVLRTFRIVRVLKLARSFESLRIILVTLTKSVISVTYLFILMLLFILIFALLGMEFFGGRYPRPEYNYTPAYYPQLFEDQKIDWGDDGPSRYNFDSFGESFLSIFVILSGENWNEIWQDSHVAAWNSPDYGGYTATIYFLILFVAGNLIFFNLFIAILLSNFDESDEDEEEEDEEGEEGADDGLDAAMGAQRKTQQGGEGKDMPMMSYTFGNYRDPQEAEMRKSGHIKVSGEPQSTTEVGDEEKPRRKSQAPPPDEDSGDKSCMIFSWANPVRRGAAYVVWHPWFDPVIIALIVTSSILLAIDDPRLDTTDPFKVAIANMNLFFTAAFILEMLLKIIVLGFIYSRNKAIPAYLRSGWNILDFLVVIISILTLLADAVPALAVVSGLKALRTFRALRPLRLISRLEGMKQVINTLIKSIPSVATLGLVMILFFTIFDIIAMQLFGGKLGRCLDPLETYGGVYSPGYECITEGSCPGSDFPPFDLYATLEPGSHPECTDSVPCYYKPVDELPGGGLVLFDFDNDGKINDFEECLSLPKYNLSRVDSLGRLLQDVPGMNERFYSFPQWVQPEFGNFDNFFYGFLLLFEIAALEGWPDVMFWVIDSDVDFQFIEPSRIEMHQQTNSSYAGVWVGRNNNGTTGEKTRYFGEGWQDGEGHGSNHKSNGWPPTWYGPVFFVLWILLGSFIILNMVVGVVLDAYNRIKSEGSGTAFMTEGQADWVATQRSVIAMRPLKSANPPTQSWRMWAYHLVEWNIFDLFIMIVIVCNMIFFFPDFYAPGHENIDQIRTVLNVANYIFLAIYIIEMCLKWLGLGFKQYFKDPWNQFDFTLVALSIFDVIMSSVGGDLNFPASVIRVLRLFRVVRILRIFKTAKSLRAILMTIILSMPALYNVTMLMVLFIFIFAVFCVSFFFSVQYTELDVANAYPMPEYYWYSTTTSYGGFITRHANFETFGMAILTLVRCVTGESFNGIMHETMSVDWGENMLRCCPSCGYLIDTDERPAKDVMGNDVTDLAGGKAPVTSCGASLPSVTIFILYCVFMGFVILALIIGVILDNFANVGSENKAVTVEHIEEFREVWLRYDPKGTFVVPSHNLLAILQQLRQPLGIADRTPPFSRSQMLQFLGALDIPDHGGSIHFLEALTALSHAVCGVPVPLCDATRGLQKAAQKVPKLGSLEKPAHNALTNYLVSLLQSRWRGYAMRKKYSDHNIGEVAAAGEGLQPPPPPPDVTEGKVKGNQVAPAP